MHIQFHYHSLEEIEMTQHLPFSRTPEALLLPISIAGKKLNTRAALQPMEGTDGTGDGTPDEKTRRRYLRFAAGGAGLIWFEAVSIAPEAQASAHQLRLTKDNLDAFRRLLGEVRETGMRENGYVPMIIMQATHSGRYAKPHGFPEPLISYNCPPLEDEPINPGSILSDDDLRRYEDMYGETARLSQAAGFDGMDIKCCHRYLASELLSAYTRNGLYGSSLENRSRFLKNAYRAAKSAISGDFFLTSRINIYDGFPHPYGFGVDKEGLTPDYTEPINVIGELYREFRIPLINITMGNPYKNPHVNRPYDHGDYVPAEHPLFGERRMMEGVAAVQKALPQLPVLGSAFSYLRQYAPNLAAGMIEQGNCALAGFGRLALAYPDFIRDLKREGALNPQKVCIACGGCAQLLRAGKPAGCVVRDKEVYSL